LAAADLRVGPKADGIVASVGGRSITGEELDKQLGNQLLRVRAEEYATKKRALDELIDKMLIEEEAKRHGTSTEALLMAEVTGKAKPVTAEEVRAAYDASKDRMPEVPEADALDRIEKSMKAGRERSQRATFVKGLRGTAGVKVLLEPPRVAVEPGDAPSIGREDAPVNIVIFADFQCPYCQRSAAFLRQVREKNERNVRVVFRHFPLPMHPQAGKASEAAECARDQGKFWELHDRLFSNQKALGVSDLKRFAQELELDAETFATCLDSGRTVPRLEADVAAGRSYGVSGTPTIFVNGRLWSGAPSVDEMTSVIEEELQRRQGTGPGAERSASAK
jgi:protein-disulfide isomerase